MDDSERLVERYLKSLNRGEVIFEPDGNVPPDFRLGEGIAVEVRRLNQNFASALGQSRGLEEVSIPLSSRIRRLLPTLGPAVAGENWWVSLRFRRPIDSVGSIERVARRELLSFENDPRRAPTTIRLGANVSLEIVRSDSDHEHFFVFAGYNDYDSGGWVVHELAKSLRQCIVEKEQKIAAYRAKYDAWWLVLPNRTQLGMSNDDCQQLRALSEASPHGWAKVVILDMRGQLRAIEI